MTNPIASQLIAADYQHRRATSAAHRRLIALATCCRPSRLTATIHALRTRKRKSLGPVACCV